MVSLVFPDDFFHEFLRLQFPGQYVVCIHDTEESKKTDYAISRLIHIFPDRPSVDWRFHFINAGYALLVCGTKEEAFRLYHHFEDETLAPYTTVFGPCESEPRGCVLTENT